MNTEVAQQFARTGQWSVVCIPKDGADVLVLPSTCEKAAVARITAKRIDRANRWLLIFDQFAQLRRYADGDQSPRLLWTMVSDQAARRDHVYFAGPRPKKGYG